VMLVNILIRNDMIAHFAYLEGSSLSQAGETPCWPADEDICNKLRNGGGLRRGFLKALEDYIPQQAEKKAEALCNPWKYAVHL
jgi:hypothetical protein